MWTNTPRLIQSQLEQRFWWALPRSSHAVHFSSVSRLSSSGLHCERLRCPDHISDRSLPRSKAKGWALKGSGRNAGSGDGRFELGPPFDPRNRGCSPFPIMRLLHPGGILAIRTLPRDVRHAFAVEVKDITYEGEKVIS